MPPFYDGLVHQQLTETLPASDTLVLTLCAILIAAILFPRAPSVQLAALAAPDAGVLASPVCFCSYALYGFPRHCTFDHGAGLSGLELATLQ